MDEALNTLEARVDAFFGKVGAGLDSQESAYAAECAKDDVAEIVELLALIQERAAGTQGLHLASFALEDQGKSVEQIERELPGHMTEASTSLAAVASAQQVSAGVLRGVAPPASRAARD
ncbi:hypothetical protein FVE85_6083 [Porphyridium purpureum]|uniref:Uncharacterized protein n=1 Tax=Porphyridium purpureum TaxID=35688 RepID=A0A5J4Z5K4_PORPP|nr:hypothetical protein FVE85_6083 [Porphyridium purpureum]|eukprot:POR4816..scf295_1